MAPALILINTKRADSDKVTREDTVSNKPVTIQFIHIRHVRPSLLPQVVTIFCYFSYGYPHLQTINDAAHSQMKRNTDLTAGKILYLQDLNIIFTHTVYIFSDFR